MHLSREIGAANLARMLPDLLERPSPLVRALLVAGLALTIAGGAAFVYVTGGTTYVYAHVLYVPILLSAYLFGIPGGVLAGVAAGLAIGPHMPLDTATGVMQAPVNWISRAAFFTGSGALAGAVVTLLRFHTRKVREASHQDPLTGLPNWLKLVHSLDERVRGEKTESDGFLLIIAEVVPHERYDEIIATLGHARTDRLIVDAARTVEANLPGGGHVYLVGGTALAIEIPYGGFEDSATVREHLLDVLNSSAFREEVPIYAEPRLGTARFPRHGTTSADLLQAATSALSDAVHLDKRQAVFDPRQQRAREDRYQILRELASGLRDRPPFVLHFQPLVSVSGGHPVGAEALLRWQHPTRGWIPPGIFIPLAEQTLLMKPLTEWVLARGLEWLADHEAASPDFVLSVNVSVRNLEDPAFPQRVAAMLEFFGVSSSRLGLEITETGLMRHLDTTLAQLSGLRSLGVRIALDDFGTGQSSLAYLKHLPIDAIKLDRSFVQGMMQQERDALLVDIVVQLCQRLGVRSVAEGVEDPETLDGLAARACDVAQGYHFARPMPADAFDEWLGQRQSGATRSPAYPSDPSAGRERGARGSDDRPLPG